MPKWIDLAANESAGWAIPLEKTRLKAETALFWKLEKERSHWNTPVTSEKSKDGVDDAQGAFGSHEATSTALVAKPTSTSVVGTEAEDSDASGEFDVIEDSNGRVPLAA